LREAFKQYGKIEEGSVIIHKVTGKSRGFGFIIFKHMESAQKALQEPSKTIDGRITVCNLATVSQHPFVILEFFLSSKF
jgi:heterogeneous nuclear ribonucleoprotein A1/A3